MEEHFDVPARILELQGNVKMSNHELAVRCNVDDAAASRWLKDTTNPTLRTLEKICYALGLTLVDFFSKDTGRERRKQGNNQRLRRLWRAADDKQQALIVFIGEAIVIRGNSGRSDADIVDEIRLLAEEFQSSQKMIVNMDEEGMPHLESE